MNCSFYRDGKYIIFDADTGNSVRMIPAAGGDVIKFLPDSVLIQNGGLPCWSPDGSQIAFRDEGRLPLPGGWWIDGKSIIVANIDRQTRKCTMLKISVENGGMTTVSGHNENFYRHTALSPDGSLITYAVMEGKYLGLYIMPSEGGKSLPLAVAKDGHTEGVAWSPDGKKIAFTRTQGRNFDIWVMEVDNEKIKEELHKIR
jgi:Tol biopolymer transport system component